MSRGRSVMELMVSAILALRLDTFFGESDIK